MLRSFRMVILLAGILLASPVTSGANASPDDPTPDEIQKPTRQGGSWSARLVYPAPATARPGAGRIVARLRTSTSWSHQPQTLMVLESRVVAGKHWLKVMLPIRPNGSTGWIPRNRVTLSQSRLWLEVRKSSRRVVVFRKGRRLGHFRAVIGASGTPTPAGFAAIYERNRQPNPREFLGPWALSLTSLSRRLMNYGGGPGRIALHGRGGKSLKDPLGSAASNGCIRLPNPAIRWLAKQAKPGTPVVIRNR